MKAAQAYKMEYPVKLGDIDFSRKMKLSALFNCLQEAASIHADSLGVGFDVLGGRYGATWVLIRMKAEIIRYPELNETLSIETWPQLPRKVEFERDFVVRDRGGSIIARAVSAWVLLDLEKRELKKSDSINFELPGIREERAIAGKTEKLKAFGAPEKVYDKHVFYSDIDLNGHLNSSRYVDFIMDCFSLEEHKSGNVVSIQVNYINEAFAGETFVMNRDASPDNPNLVYIEGVNAKGSDTVFKALLDIRKSALE